MKMHEAFWSFWKEKTKRTETLKDLLIMFSSGFTKFKKHWIVTCLHVWALRVYKQKTPKKIPKRRSKSQKQNPKTSIKIPKVYGFCWLRSKAQMARGVCYFLKRNDQTAWDIQPIVFREREIVRDICRLFETNDETVRNIRHLFLRLAKLHETCVVFFEKLRNCSSNRCVDDERPETSRGFNIHS